MKGPNVSSSAQKEAPLSRSSARPTGGSSRLLLAGVGFVLLCLTAGGCFLDGATGDRGPEGPVGRVPLLVNGMIEARDARYPDGYFSVDAQESGDVPSVRLNGVPIPYHAVGQFGAATGNFVSFAPGLAAGDSARVDISYTSTTGTPGAARARFQLPGAFEMTRPAPDSAIIAITRPLHVAWTAAHGSAGYEVDGYFDCVYTDPANNNRSLNLTLDTLVTADSVTIPAAAIFPDPDSIQTFSGGSGAITVYALVGPLHEGDPENVTGDGAGSIIGITSGGTRQLSFTNPPARRPRSADQRRR